MICVLTVRETYAREAFFICQAGGWPMHPCVLSRTERQVVFHSLILVLMLMMMNAIKLQHNTIKPAPVARCNCIAHCNILVRAFRSPMMKGDRCACTSTATSSYSGYRIMRTRSSSIIDANPPPTPRRPPADGPRWHETIEHGCGNVSHTPNKRRVQSSCRECQRWIHGPSSGNCSAGYRRHDDEWVKFLDRPTDRLRPNQSKEYRVFLCVDNHDCLGTSSMLPTLPTGRDDSRQMSCRPSLQHHGTPARSPSSPHQRPPSTSWSCLPSLTTAVTGDNWSWKIVTLTVHQFFCIIISRNDGLLSYCSMVNTRHAAEAEDCLHCCCCSSSSSSSSNGSSNPDVS